jgi:uncharacterized surface protein with fasciclin (FAS1) repeats
MNRIRKLVVVGVAFAALVAACGDDDAAPTTTTLPATTTTTMAPTTTVALADIVGTADAAGTFTTLLAAVEAAGLTATLQGEGPFTVFAPTDEAFALLPEGTLEALLADIPALTDILLYHVVPGAVLSGDVVMLESATTVQGADITIEVVDGEVILNGSVKVTVVDIAASNGVIHVIDAVLLPPTE